MLLSIIVPGIRPHNWQRLYDSAEKRDEYEWIFIGPVPDNNVTLKPNVKFIEDWGNPARAMQLGLIAAKGDYVHWNADDAYFLKGEPERGLAESKSSSDKNIIVTSKYNEGASIGMDVINYYMLSSCLNHKNLYIGQDWLILNMGFVLRKILLDAGGWDAQFETLFWTHTDLAVRLQRIGYKFILSQHPVAHCDHMPGTSGDHAPIHYSHIQHDEPLFYSIYSKPESIERRNIRLDNWRISPDRWERRFGQ